MTNIVDFDPYFDDEDEANEEVYRQLLRNQEPLPSCDSTTAPMSSVSERCALCSREEAENILKTNVCVRPGNFLVRPSAHVNYPYSMSVLNDKKSIFHFQIGQISNQYTLGPLKTSDMLKAKLFPSLSSFLEYYLTCPIKFKDENGDDSSILLQLFTTIEVTRL